MNEDAKEILSIIKAHLIKNPSERFTQALFNLGINEFTIPSDPARCGYQLRDPYEDRDIDLLNKIKIKN